MATEFSDRDGGLGGLGIDKHGHDSLGPMDPHLLAHPGGHLGYSASDAMFLDEGYIEVPAHTFVNDTPQPERSNDVAPTVPVPLQSYVTLYPLVLHGFSERIVFRVEPLLELEIRNSSMDKMHERSPHQGELLDSRSMALYEVNSLDDTAV
jgi:hypothetical protein